MKQRPNWQSSASSCRRARLHHAAAEAANAAETLGFPVVLKGLGVAHKTEAGAVKLNLPIAKPGS